LHLKKDISVLGSLPAVNVLGLLFEAPCQSQKNNAPNGTFQLQFEPAD